jgi:capsular polysaccharide biosynthesis protein
MDLREYVRVLFKRGWMVVLIALVGGLGAIGFSKLQQPIYRSTISLGAIPARPDYGQGLASKELLHNYSQQIVTTKMLQPVIDQLQLDITPEKLKERVNVSADEADLLINIEVKDPIQANAPKVAQAIADAFVVKHRQDNLQVDQQNRILVDVHDGPTPVELFSPKTRINAVAGGILGALVGVFVVFLLEYLESAYVRNSEDVERLLGLTVLGSIPTMTEKATASTEGVRARRWFWQRA